MSLSKNSSRVSFPNAQLPAVAGSTESAPAPLPAQLPAGKKSWLEMDEASDEDDDDDEFLQVEAEAPAAPPTPSDEDEAPAAPSNGGEGDDSAADDAAPAAPSAQEKSLEDLLVEYDSKLVSTMTTVQALEQVKTFFCPPFAQPQSRLSLLFRETHPAGWALLGDAHHAALEGRATLFSQEEGDLIRQMFPTFLAYRREQDDANEAKGLLRAKWTNLGIFAHLCVRRKFPAYLPTSKSSRSAAAGGGAAVSLPAGGGARGPIPPPAAATTGARRSNGRNPRENASPAVVPPPPAISGEGGEMPARALTRRRRNAAGGGAEHPTPAVERVPRPNHQRRNAAGVGGGAPAVEPDHVAAAITVILSTPGLTPEQIAAAIARLR